MDHLGLFVIEHDALRSLVTFGFGDNINAEDVRSKAVRALVTAPAGRRDLLGLIGHAYLARPAASALCEAGFGDLLGAEIEARLGIPEHRSAAAGLIALADENNIVTDNLIAECTKPDLIGKAKRYLLKHAARAISVVHDALSLLSPGDGRSAHGDYAAELLDTLFAIGEQAAVARIEIERHLLAVHPRARAAAWRAYGMLLTPEPMSRVIEERFLVAINSDEDTGVRMAAQQALQRLYQR